MLGLIVFGWLADLWTRLAQRRCPAFGHQLTARNGVRTRTKPAWVKAELLRLKARMPKAGCRSLADIFNRRHGPDVTVGKSYVADLLKRQTHAVWMEWPRMRNRKPGRSPRNFVWGLDMTGKMDSQGRLHMILGLVDHGSRLALELARLKDKRAWTLLAYLARTVWRYGRPRFVRTDNEPVFSSIIFRLGLRLLDIRHQQTEPHCPWQNGRVERFFGTLKEPLDQRAVKDGQQLDRDLVVFRFWYNQVRPHHNLDGRTPWEAWRGIDPYARRIRLRRWFSAWDRLLRGEVYRL